METAAVRSLQGMIVTILSAMVCIDSTAMIRPPFVFFRQWNLRLEY